MSNSIIGKSRFGCTTLLGAAAVLALTGCADNDPDDPIVLTHPEVSYEAKIERTEGGVPHITANDFGSLGFGTGYAAAQDNFCELAINVLRYRSELAQNFGAGEPSDAWAGPEYQNSDLFYKMMVERGIFDHDVDPELETQFAGFAAGFNRYLKDTGIENIPDPACRGADWVQQMTVEDVRRFHLKPVFLPNLASRILPAELPAATVARIKDGGSDTLTTEAVAQQTAHHPAAPDALQPVPITSLEDQIKQAKKLEQLASIDFEYITNPYDKGSNGVAVGRESSTSGKSALYTNPHLDWAIDFRMYPRHHIIPGVLNELGANTYERSNVGFGTNGDIAWTNTVSTSKAVTFRELTMVDGDPMSYVFDGEIRQLEALPITVNVKNPDGSLTEISHTFYLSHYGFMVKLGPLPWGYSLHMAEEGPRGMQGGAIGIARSKTVRELKESLNKSQHTAATNTIAADTGGEVLYGDLGPVAGLTDQQFVELVDGGCDVFGGGAVFRGDTSACDWNTDPDSAAEGLLGASKQAHLFRTDYVTNSNDNSWLTNPKQPLTGVPLVQGGTVDSERTLRTRSGLTMVQQRIDGVDGLGGNTFDLASLQQQMLSNQNYAGQILRDDVVTLCNAHPSVTVPAKIPNEGDVERTIDISSACPVLSAWDLKSNLDSRGSHLFREFMRAGNGGEFSRLLPESFNYAVAFDINDPVGTPRGLDTSDNPLVLQSLAIAVETLNRAGIALDANLGDIQTVTRGEVIPWHGGEEFEGVFNKAANELDETAGGYPEATGSGASWIMVTEFTDAGPVSKGNLVYSLSTNTESPHYNDMTKLFSNKQLVDLPYHPEDVTAAAISTLEVSEGADSCLDGGWQNFTGEAFTSEAECIDFFRQVNENRVTEYVSTGYEKPAQ